MLGLGLSLWSSTILGRGADPYGVLAFKPKLVFDFAAEKYRTGGSSTTFDEAITYTGASNKTMVDSDGLLKWAPHNLALNSAAPATQSITVISGADYTVECTGVSIALSGAGSGTVTEGNPVEITASTTTLTLTVTGATGTMWAYRSDLGGMVDNPDRGDSYVPTTTAARYLPRRGHHVWNGSAWVNEGLLVESEQRTNLLTYSDDFGNAIWDAGSDSADTTQDAVDINGVSNSAWTITDSSASLFDVVRQTVTVSANTATYTGSVFIKKTTSASTFPAVVLSLGPTPSIISQYDFDTNNGVLYLRAGATGTGGVVEDYNEDYWRVSWTITNNGSKTSLAFNVYPAVVTDFVSASSASLTGSVVIYGAQLEVGNAGASAPTPSSYMPTSGAQFTRAAETLTVASADLPYNATAMSIQMQGLLNYSDEGAAAQQTFLRWHADANNYILWDLDTDSTATGEVNFNQAAASVVDTVATSGTALAPSVATPFNIAGRHGSTFINGAIAGTALTADTTPVALAALSSTNMTLAHDMMGTLKLVRMWDENVTDAGLEAATT